MKFHMADMLDAVPTKTEVATKSELREGDIFILSGETVQVMTVVDSVMRSEFAGDPTMVIKVLELKFTGLAPVASSVDNSPQASKTKEEGSEKPPMVLNSTDDMRSAPNGHYAAGTYDGSISRDKDGNPGAVFVKNNGWWLDGEGTVCDPLDLAGNYYLMPLPERAIKPWDDNVLRTLEQVRDALDGTYAACWDNGKIMTRWGNEKAITLTCRDGRWFSDSGEELTADCASSVYYLLPLF